MITSTLLALQA